MRRYGLKRLALFGSYAREDQREDSDVDILVEIEPSIGLGFVELADRIEDVLGVFHRRCLAPGDQATLLGEHRKGFDRCPVGKRPFLSRIFGKRLRKLSVT